MVTNAYISLGDDVNVVPADTHKEWNSLQVYAGGSSVALDDDSNVSTGWTMTIDASFPADGEGGSNTPAQGTGDLIWVDEDVIGEAYQFMTTPGNVAKYDFTGLNNGKTYKLELFSYRSSAGSRIGEFSVDGFSSTQEIDPVNNLDTVVTFSGISPSSGEITLSFRHKSGEDNAYLNAIWIQEEDAGGGLSIPVAYHHYSKNIGQ